MSQIDHASDIAFSTEFAVDKIVGVYTGSYNSATDTTVLGGFVYSYAIPHSFTRPVFCELLWSTDGVNFKDGGGSGGIAISDSSNVYVMTTLPTGTIHYKVICSWIDDYDATNPLITPVLNTTSNEYFDSRFNYQKTYLNDMYTVSASPLGTTTPISHNLGYAPNAKVFIEALPGQVWPTGLLGKGDPFFYDFSQYEAKVVITSTQLEITHYGGGASNARIWYKVYLDS